MTNYYDKEKNQKEREWFIKYWTDYIKKVPDRVWSRQQAVIINSALKPPKDKNIKKAMKKFVTGK